MSAVKNTLLAGPCFIANILADENLVGGIDYQKIKEISFQY